MSLLHVHVHEACPYWVLMAAYPCCKKKYEPEHNNEHKLENEHGTDTDMDTVKSQSRT
jgi:hypothetical protein